MRVALVHDYLNQYGGAEQVLSVFLDIFPEADLYTILYHPPKLPKELIYKVNKRVVITSFLNKLYLPKLRHDLFSFFMPLAVESWNFADYDLIISSSASYSKGVITNSRTIHISYIHSPTRYLWENPDKYVKNSHYSIFIKAIYRPFFSLLRQWDFLAAKRPDYLIANSKYTQKRIFNYYREKSTVIYPPCNIKHLLIKKAINSSSDFYVLISRLIQYKKVDLAIQTFNLLKKPLKIIGDGPLYKYLKGIAGNTIQFLGYIPDQEKYKILSKAKGLIFPQEEDFGISLVEALALGVPAIAYKNGGALEIIKDGLNGIFFDQQSSQSLKNAILKFEKTKFDAKIIKKTVHKFEKNNFIRQFKKFTTQAIKNYGHL